MVSSRGESCRRGTPDALQAGRLTDDLPVVCGMHQNVEGQPGVGQGTGLQAVLQQVGALHVRGRADAAVGQQVLQQADVLEEGVRTHGTRVRCRERRGSG